MSNYLDTTVDLVNGSAIATLPNGENITNFRDKYILYITGFKMFRVLSTTAPSGGTSTATLSENFAGATGTYNAQFLPWTPKLNELADALQAQVETFPDLTQSTTDTTAGRVTRVGDFGLGNTAILISDWNTEAVESGFYQSQLSANGNSNSPNDNYAGWTGFTTKLNNGNYSQMVWRAGVASVIECYTRFYAGVTFTGWQEFLHSGNTNFNRFGYSTSGLCTPHCFAKGANAVRIYLPINLFSAPSSFMVEGTFKLQRVGAVDVATGIAAFTTIQITGRWIILEVSGLTGLTNQEQLILLSETNASGITVNP